MYAGYSQDQAGTAALPYGSYGATPPFCDFRANEFAVKPPFSRGQRRSTNLIALTVCLFLPWVIFTTVFSVQSFSLHYDSPESCAMLCGVLLVGVFVLGYFAFEALRQRTEGVQEPAWYVFIFVTSLIAWIIALGCGQANFAFNMSPFFDISNLNAYRSVDPSKFRGNQLMDAGRIMFTPDSHLDLTKSMAFTNLDTYCVAPVTVGGGTNSTPLDFYDFWAVGLNCCTGHVDFHCSEYNNPKALSGLRLMNDDQRAYFRLAVQQAEAAHNIHAPHPIFMHWSQDPAAEINAYQDAGYKYFLLGTFSHFAAQLFLVVIASIAFPKLSI